MTSLLEIPLKEKSWEKLLNFKNQTLDFLEQHQAILKASLLVFIAIVFFVGIAFPETIQTHFFSRQRWFGLTSVILYLLFSYICPTYQMVLVSVNCCFGAVKFVNAV